jgi:hypothetical protein
MSQSSRSPYPDLQATLHAKSAHSLRAIEHVYVLCQSFVTSKQSISIFLQSACRDFPIKLISQLTRFSAAPKRLRDLCSAFQFKPVYLLFTSHLLAHDFQE